MSLSWEMLNLELIRNLGIPSLIVGILYFFIVKPYHLYYNFRDYLTKSAMKHSSTILNTGLPSEEYKETFNELNEWLGEMNVLKNRLKLNEYLSFLGIPSDDELQEAIENTAFMRNALGRQKYFVDSYHKYNRLMEIFNINQPK